MRKGSALPLVLILIAFIVIPLAFWFYSSGKNSASVKGARSVGGEKGFYVTIDSISDTWDLNVYLCKDRSACGASVTAGLPLEKVSGGAVKDYIVKTAYKDSWNDYNYVKVFVKSGWGSLGKSFKISEVGEVFGSTVETITTDGSTQEVLVFPAKEVKDTFARSAKFSD